MKTQSKTEKKTWIEQFHQVRYLKTNETVPHKPLTDHNGIHCEGDKFGYICDWQVDEKKRHERLS